jgi:ABC-2 type transport system ATP-binding protein
VAETAVSVENVTKVFRMHRDRNQTLKAALLHRKRADYEEFLALEDVSLSVPTGTTFGLIGENGSGKSTLLKCMAKILRPDKGSIAIVGMVSALLELGAGFHPELSGRENVYLNGSILGLGRKDLDKRFDEIVDFAGLERFIDTPVKNYSSGMYVRLGFSVAINVEPDVLLVDEVLAVGDEQFQRKCAEKFAELRAGGRTIVLVSHSLGSVRSMCDHAAWLDHGHLRLEGTANDVIDGYLETVHSDRQEEPTGVGTRWGSGEARIEKIELLDRDGRPTSKVYTGDKVTFRLHVNATEPITGPVFGLGIHTLEGMHVTGPNTREAGVSVDRLDGPGTVDLVDERLLLLPGTYDLSAALTDSAALHQFDYRHRAHRFDVGPGTPHETYGGVVSLDGRWQVQ